MPLTKGIYPQHSIADAVLGNFRNKVQPNVPVFSNLNNPGMGTLVDETAGLVTAKNIAVPIAVDYGVEISQVSFLTGATAESTGSHLNVSLWSGIAVPLNLGQSTDITGATYVGTSSQYTLSLSTPVLITPTVAPNGFIYASIGITATGVPSVVGAAIPTAVDYQWNVGGASTATCPIGYALEITGGGATAPTWGSPAVFGVAPVIFLS